MSSPLPWVQSALQFAAGLVSWICFVTAAFLTGVATLSSGAKGGCKLWIYKHWHETHLANIRTAWFQFYCQGSYHIAFAYLGGVLRLGCTAVGMLAALLYIAVFCRSHSYRPTLYTTSPTTTIKKSRLGPKSQGRFRTKWLSPFLWSILLAGTASCADAADARVSGPPTGSLGATASAGAKHCGLSGGTLGASDLPAARKRSFKRALNRAMRTGSTFYRGRIFTSDGLEKLRARRNPETGQIFHKQHASKRLRVLSVNLDGMTTVVYDTLINWMQAAPYDILFLQETHRGFGDEQAEWKAGQWTFISSPDPKTRFAGVAIAIRTTVAAHFAARCLPVIPGRLLHVRLSGGAYGERAVLGQTWTLYSHPATTQYSDRSWGLQLCSQAHCGSRWRNCAAGQSLLL